MSFMDLTGGSTRMPEPMPIFAAHAVAGRATAPNAQQAKINRCAEITPVFAHSEAKRPLIPI